MLENYCETLNSSSPMGSNTMNRQRSNCFQQGAEIQTGIVRAFRSLLVHHHLLWCWRDVVRPSAPPPSYGDQESYLWITSWHPTTANMKRQQSVEQQFRVIIRLCDPNSISHSLHRNSTALENQVHIRTFWHPWYRNQADRCLPWSGCSWSLEKSDGYAYCYKEEEDIYVGTVP